MVNPDVVVSILAKNENTPKNAKNTTYWKSKEY